MISPPMVDALNSSSDPSDAPDVKLSDNPDGVPLASRDDVGRSGDSKRESDGGTASDGGGVVVESSRDGCSSLIDD